MQVKVTPRVDGKVVLRPVQPTKDAPARTPPQKEVTHLPEVTLYVKYPPSYPSHAPPECHLSARWMDTKVTPFLSERLRGMFVSGCPVVYEWIMYLQDEMVADYGHHCDQGSSEKHKVRKELRRVT